MKEPAQRELDRMIDSVTCHYCGQVFRGWWKQTRAYLHQIVRHSCSVDCV